jgi:hypothetical protein
MLVRVYLDANRTSGQQLLSQTLNVHHTRAKMIGEAGPVTTSGSTPRPMGLRLQHIANQAQSTAGDHYHRHAFDRLSEEGLHVGTLIHGPEQGSMLHCHRNVDSSPHRRLKAAVYEPSDRLKTRHSLPRFSDQPFDGAMVSVGHMKTTAYSSRQMLNRGCQPN